MKDKVIAVLAGGFLMGIISALPVIGWIFFIWALLGGFLTMFLYIRKAPQPVQMVEGVIMGGLAGLLGSIINLIGYVIVQFIIQLIYAGVLSANGGSIEQMLPGAIAGMTFGVVLNLIFILPIILMGLLGGLLGTAVLEKRNSSDSNANPVNYNNYMNQ